MVQDPTWVPTPEDYIEAVEELRRMGFSEEDIEEIESLTAWMDHPELCMILSGDRIKKPPVSEPKSQSPAKIAPASPGPSCSTIIFTCGNCDQKLRLPTVKGLLKVRCPSCDYSFNYRIDVNLP
jgi:hypothetical protein